MKERLLAVGWSLLFLLTGYLLAVLLLQLAGRLLPIPEPNTLAAAAVETTALLLGYGAMTWLIGVRVLHWTAADFGLSPAGPGSRGFGWGLLVGGLLAGAAMLVAVPLGHASWRDDGGGVLRWLATVLVTGAIMLPAALAEELAFRGVPLLTLAKRFGRAPALIALAALFSFAHADNPGVTGLALANIGLAGIFLGLAFFTRGGLWTSTGAHLGWNLTMAGLAAPVSGLALPMPWLDYAPGRPGWLTGGGFGPEGGALATLCILGGALLALRRRKEHSA
ncbi:MAG TPA: CPBP family intramembrane glutamic endopeptidase [Gemmatimonadales bacterium]|nr:CPBP family intramembrane glutamic endopeptidase [Gemmatimonadales bacterium]